MTDQYKAPQDQHAETLMDAEKIMNKVRKGLKPFVVIMIDEDDEKLNVEVAALTQKQHYPFIVSALEKMKPAEHPVKAKLDALRDKMESGEISPEEAAGEALQMLVDKLKNAA